MSQLVLSDILRLFFNTLTADDNYSQCNMQKFAKEVQTALSVKEKNFSAFFIAFPKYGWNLKHFQKNDGIPSLVISEIIDPERGFYLNV